jgi:hypothetical protein
MIAKKQNDRCKPACQCKDCKCGPDCRCGK